MRSQLVAVAATYPAWVMALLLRLACAPAVVSVARPPSEMLPLSTEVAANTNTYCLACEAAVRVMGKQGCKLVCTAMPPGPEQEICEWVLGYSHMCVSIEGWLKRGLNDSEICTHLGFCGSDCQCGVCTAATAGPGGRCLGAPNSCGHNASAASRGQVSSGVGVAAAVNRSAVCFDGQCGDPLSIGCCVTCL